MAVGSVLQDSEEVIRLFEGKDVDLVGIPEGAVFRSRSFDGIKVPLSEIRAIWRVLSVRISSFGLHMLFQRRGDDVGALRSLPRARPSYRSASAGCIQLWPRS